MTTQTETDREGTVSAHISVIGQIDVREPDDAYMTVPIGLLLRFDTVEDLRKAFNDGVVRFSFSGEQVES